MKIFKKFKKTRKKKEVLDQDYTCKNCGTEFYGRFCPHCSQSIKEFEQPIGFMIVDFVGNMFAFDTRFWKTFKAVLYKPGHMANSFVEGHRVRYMPPFRFYIFMSFVFFLLLNITVKRNFPSNGDFNNGSKSSALRDSAIIAKIDSTFKATSNKVKVDSIVRLELAQELGRGKADSIIDNLKAKYSGKDINGKIKEKLTKTKDNPEDKLARIKYSENDSDFEFITDKKIKKHYESFKAHPEFYYSKALQAISWSLFLFMPFFACILWLFFGKAHKYYVVHLVYAINQHAFLFIVFSFMMIVHMCLPEAISGYSGYLMLTLPVYHFVGAKQLYKQGNRRTFFKLLGVGCLYWFSVIVGITIIEAFWFYYF